MFDYPLLMTASVNTRGMAGLSVTDQADRMQQYISTLEFYLGCRSIRRIVFAENSNTELERLRRVARRYPDREVEFISCDLNNYPRHLGKSYGELRLIDHAFLTSKLIGESEGFIKVTGRFPIVNIEKLLLEAQRRQPWALFCDTKDHPIYDWLGNGWNGHAADTRFFCVSSQFYREHFLDKYHLLDDKNGCMIEGLFFSVIKDRGSRDRIVSRFRTEPEPQGTAGHEQISIIGSNNYSGYLATSKRRIRQLGRWVAPWFRF